MGAPPRETSHSYELQVRLRGPASKSNVEEQLRMIPGINLGPLCVCMHVYLPMCASQHMPTSIYTHETILPLHTHENGGNDVTKGDSSFGKSTVHTNVKA